VECTKEIMRRPRIILWRCYTYNMRAREKGTGGELVEWARRELCPSWRICDMSYARGRGFFSFCRIAFGGSVE